MDRKKLLIIIGVLLIAVFLFFFFTAGSNKFYNWSETYKIDSKQPYGGYIYHELMKTHYDENFTIIESPVAASLSADQEQSLYVFLGREAYYRYEDLDSLTSFVSAGNSALLATTAFPYDLSYEIYFDECGVISSEPAEKIMMKFEKEPEEYAYEYIMYWRPVSNYWSYLDSLECTDVVEVLAYFNEDKPNFFRVKFGEGYFYFHTTPLVFGNYYLKNEESLAYVEQVMSYFQVRQVYWDEFSKTPFDEAESKDSPLKYILSQPPLKWAWYLLLITSFIYMIFYAKRRQRIIPVLEPNTNTTIEFAETMGYLYFEEQNHKKIADHKMNLFLSYIRHNYNLLTNVLDDNLIKRVSLKSQVPFEEVEKIFKEYQRLDFKVEISADDLVAFHEMIESFYQKSK
ncbi:hypothetical protein JMN32_04565 [Fulvivirga sp. 29W222]|uniref:DUF4350 domain-containing protein n=1 Tax=Fulvivirga marina TaxID=2494733 RepID=A0A937FW33_9BACT|nr:hypothetical protein [Fulvivirga marina]MBL6445568.1 hypothetical protein [Fulvivirga marina]